MQPRTIEMHVGNLFIGLAVDFNYQLHRPRRPAFEMGTPDPRNFEGGRAGCTGTITSLQPTAEGEAFLLKYRAYSLNVTLNFEAVPPYQVDRIVELAHMSMTDVYKSATTGEWTINFICSKLSKSDTPKNNKQAMRLLLKR